MARVAWRAFGFKQLWFLGCFCLLGGDDEEEEDEQEDGEQESDSTFACKLGHVLNLGFKLVMFYAWFGG